jgi:hypothetical protein
MIQIDIDMPINCATCPFTRAINTYSFDSMCVLTKKKANEIRHREEWCPLREVVRCKDCKYYTDAEAIPCKDCSGFCARLGAVSYYGVDATDFCSFGERRKP